MSFSQLVPYWDSQNLQFQGPGNIPHGSVEIFEAIQATGASATIPLGIATRAGKIADVRVAAITPLGSPDTFTIDIRRTPLGGSPTSILTGATPIALTAGTTARASVVGSLATTTVAVGDFFEAVMTYTHSTGTAPANVVAQLQLILN